MMFQRTLLFSLAVSAAAFGGAHRALYPLDVEVVLAAMGGALSPAQAHQAGALDNLDVLESDFAVARSRGRPLCAATG